MFWLLARPRALQHAIPNLVHAAWQILFISMLFYTSIFLL
jgi:hypothetical protein